MTKTMLFWPSRLDVHRWRPFCRQSFWHRRAPAGVEQAVRTVGHRRPLTDPTQLVEHRVEALTANELHRIVVAAAVGAHLEHRNNICMV